MANRKTNLKKSKSKSKHLKTKKLSKNMSNMKNFYIFSEAKIYKKQNGKVFENSNIIKEIKNNKMLIKGYKNGKKINVTKKINPISYSINI
jgi:hypothetical protein